MVRGRGDAGVNSQVGTQPAGHYPAVTHGDHPGGNDQIPGEGEGHIARHRDRGRRQLQAQLRQSLLRRATRELPDHGGASASNRRRRLRTKIRRAITTTTRIATSAITSPAEIDPPLAGRAVVRPRRGGGFRGRRDDDRDRGSRCRSQGNRSRGGGIQGPRRPPDPADRVPDRGQHREGVGR